MNTIKCLKAAYGAATPGEWRIGDAGITVFGPKTERPAPETIANVRKKENAHFVALAHNMMPTLLEIADDLDSIIMPALLRAVETLEAIRARMNGEFDHPALIKYGPLSATRDDDILAMLNSALGEMGATDPKRSKGHIAEEIGEDLRK